MVETDPPLAARDALLAGLEDRWGRFDQIPPIVDRPTGGADAFRTGQSPTCHITPPSLAAI